MLPFTQWLTIQCEVGHTICSDWFHIESALTELTNTVDVCTL